MTIPLPPKANNTLGTVAEKQSGELEVNEYQFILDTTLKSKNRSDATILAYIDCFIRSKNNQQASAECKINPSVGYRIRHLSDVDLAIRKLIDRSAVKYGFDASEIMERTKEMVDFDPIAVQNPDGSFKSNFHDIEPEARRNIKKLKVKNLWGETEDMNGMKSKIIIGEVIEYEFYDKQKAIELVGKEKDMFKTTTKVEHTVSKDMASILLEASQRGARASLETGKRVVEIQGEVVE